MMVIVLKNALSAAAGTLHLLSDNAILKTEAPILRIRRGEEKSNAF